MITTGILKRQVWMTDDDEFKYIVKNSQRVLRFNLRFNLRFRSIRNHPYAQEFTKECNVMFVYGTYVLEGEADAKFSLGDILSLFQEDALPSKQFLQANDKFYEGVELPTKNIRYSIEH